MVVHDVVHVLLQEFTEDTSEVSNCLISMFHLDLHAPRFQDGLSLTKEEWSSFFQGLVSLYFRLKSACFAFYAAGANYAQLLLRSPLARAPYVVLFDLKPLIEDGSLLVYMYCVHAQKSLRSSKDTLHSI